MQVDQIHQKKSAAEQSETDALLKKIAETGRFTVDPASDKIIKKTLFVKAGDLVASMTAPKWVIKGMLESNALALMYGAPGDGKSFLSFDMACCVATGTTLKGRKVAQGPVVYIAGEGQGGVARRLAAWEKFHGISLADAPLYISVKAVSLLDPANAIEVVKIVEALLPQGVIPALVIIDTVARAFVGGDENSARDMSTFVNIVDSSFKDKWKANVLLVHHSGKNAEKGARGSSALKGALDQEFSLEKKEKVRTLRCTKMKDGEAMEEMVFELETVKLAEVIDQFGDLEIITSAVPVLSTKPNVGEVHNSESGESGLTVQVIVNMMLERRELGEKEWPGMNFFVEKMRIGKSRLSDMLKRAVAEGLLEKVGSGTSLKYIVKKDVES